jgi:hypothetical protein
MKEKGIMIPSSPSKGLSASGSLDLSSLSPQKAGIVPETAAGYLSSPSKDFEVSPNPRSRSSFSSVSLTLLLQLSCINLMPTTALQTNEGESFYAHNAAALRSSSLVNRDSSKRVVRSSSVPRALPSSSSANLSVREDDSSSKMIQRRESLLSPPRKEKIPTFRAKASPNPVPSPSAKLNTAGVPMQKPGEDSSMTEKLKEKLEEAENLIQILLKEKEDLIKDRNAMVKQYQERILHLETELTACKEHPTKILVVDSDPVSF